MNNKKMKIAQNFVYKYSTLEDIKHDFDIHIDKNIHIQVLKLGTDKNSKMSPAYLEKETQKELQEFYKELIKKDIKRKESLLATIDINAHLEE